MRIPGVRALMIANAERAYERKYQERLDEAQTRKDWLEVDNIKSERQLDEQYEFEKAEVAYTSRLVAEARALRVPLPDRPRPAVEDDDDVDNEHWKFSTPFGTWFLTAAGVEKVRDSIRREKDARRSARNHWLTWIGTVTGLVGALAGLVGALVAWAALQK